MKKEHTEAVREVVVTQLYCAQIGVWPVKDKVLWPSPNKRD